MRRIAAIVSCACISLAACGGAAPAPEAPRAQRRPAVHREIVRGPASIRREELDVVLEQGIGAFLSRVGVEPDVRDGAFVGFRVTELRDADLFAGVDLAPGDTVTAVNGLPIERPEQAYQAWTSLRVASELTVDVVRGDEVRQIRVPIVDPVPPAASEASSGGEAPAATAAPAS